MVTSGNGGGGWSQGWNLTAPCMRDTLSIRPGRLGRSSHGEAVFAPPTTAQLRPLS